MANFVEKATLKVIDQSTPEIRRINAALDKLFATAQKLAGVNLGRVGAMAGLSGSANPAFTDRMRRSEERAMRELAQLRAMQVKTARRQVDEAAQIAKLQERTRRSEERAARAQERAASTAERQSYREMGQVMSRRLRAQAAEERAHRRQSRLDELRGYHEKKDLAHVGKYVLHQVGVPYSGAAAFMTGLAAAGNFPRAAPMLGAAVGGAAGIAGVGYAVSKAGERDLVMKQLQMLRYGRTELRVVEDDKGNRRLVEVDEATRRLDKKSYEREVPGIGGLDSMKVTMAEAQRASGRYLNVSVTEALQQVKKLTSIMGDIPHALEMNEEMTRLTSFIKSMKGDKAGDDYKREVMAAVQSAEIAGKVNSPSEMAEYFRGMTAMKMVYGDNARFTDYLTAQRAARASFLNQGRDFRLGIFPAYVQEYGSNAGVQLATAFRHVIGGKQWREMEMYQGQRYGLMGNLETSKSGRLKKGLQSQFHLEELFSKDAFLATMVAANQVAEKDLGASLFKTKVDPKKLRNLTPQDIEALYANIDKDALLKNMEGLRVVLPNVLAKMFGDRTAADLFTKMVLQGPKMLKDRKLTLQTMDDLEKLAAAEAAGKGASAFFSMQTLPGAIGSVAAQWNNLVEAFGMPGVGVAIATMNGIARALNVLSQAVAAAPPGMLQTLTVGATALAGLATARFASKLLGKGGLPGLSLPASPIVGATAAVAGGGLLAAAAARLRAGLQLDALKSGGFMARAGALGNIAGLGVTVWQGFSQLLGGQLLDGIGTLGGGIGSLFVGGPWAKMGVMLLGTLAPHILRAIFGVEPAAAATALDVADMTPEQRTQEAERIRKRHEAEQKRQHVANLSLKREEALKAYEKAVAEGKTVKHQERLLREYRKAKTAHEKAEQELQTSILATQPAKAPNLPTGIVNWLREAAGMAPVKDALDRMWTGLKANYFDPISQWAGTFGTKINEWLTSVVPEPIKGALDGVWDKLKSTLDAIAEFIAKTNSVLGLDGKKPAPPSSMEAEGFLQQQNGPGPFSPTGPLGPGDAPLPGMDVRTTFMEGATAIVQAAAETGTELLTALRTGAGSVADAIRGALSAGVTVHVEGGGSSGRASGNTGPQDLNPGP